MIPWLVQRAAATPGAAALRIGERRVSFADLHASADATALLLRDAGVRRGDVVATLLWNGRAFVECFHAAMRIGAALLPLHARSTPDELAFALRDASARIVVHGPDELAAAAKEAADRAGGIARIDAGAAPEASLATLAPRVVGAGELLDRVGPESILAILYTSGTTGRPKGARLPLRSFLWSAAASALHLGASPSDRWLACLPLFHVGGLAILARTVLSGSCVVLHERFDAEAVAAALGAGDITHVSLVPTMLSRVLDAWGDRPAPSTLQCVLVGGAALPSGLLERARGSGFPVAPTYGLTEAASQVATLPPGAGSPESDGAAWPLPGVEIRIEGEDGTEAPPGATGEICVRGPNVMEGYHGLPDETARALRGGWLHTGDVGTVGPGGRLRVLDRRSDLVVSGGENVYPAEVEAVLASHPDVSEAAVAGEPDPDLGQRVVAAVVARPGAQPDPGDLREFCRSRLAGFKVPRRIDLVAEFPRTSSGKILRRALVAAAGAGPRTAER